MSSRGLEGREKTDPPALRNALDARRESAMKNALDVSRARLIETTQALEREKAARRRAERGRKAAAARVVALESDVTAFCMAADASLNDACDRLPAVIKSVRTMRVDLGDLGAAIGWVANTNEERHQEGTDAEDRLRFARELRAERDSLKRDLEGARAEWRHHIDKIAQALGEIPNHGESVGVQARAAMDAAGELLERSRTLMRELERERGIVDALVRKGERLDGDAMEPR